MLSLSDIQLTDDPQNPRRLINKIKLSLYRRRQVPKAPEGPGSQNFQTIGIGTW
jgi:hypothetical protein